MVREIYHVRLTANAYADLADIASYLQSEASPAIAADFLDDMLELVDSLAVFPEPGSVPRELQALGIVDFRQASKHPYRMIYRIEDRTVFVLVVADGRRDMDALLQHRLLG